MEISQKALSPNGSVLQHLEKLYRTEKSSQKSSVPLMIIMEGAF
jgi:hypothetical protein